MDESLLHAPAQGKAKPPPRPGRFLPRNDLGVVPRGDKATGRAQTRLCSMAQLSDVHITLEGFSLTGYPKLESLLDSFGDAIGFGGLERSEIQERFDVDVLRALISTLNAASDETDLVINTGDSVDIGCIRELIAFLGEMNHLGIPWFQTIGNHDRLALGNIPPNLLEAYSGLDFLDRKTFIEKHFPTDKDSSPVAYGSRAKGFDFSPRMEGKSQDRSGFYAFTAVPPIQGGPKGVIRPGLRFYVLETSRNAGSAVGQIQEQQLTWLAKELAGHSGHLAVVVSHHPIQFIREGREALLEVLHGYPQVVALLCGHEHAHRIMAIAYSSNPERGFWQIQTSSLMDFPQQARILEIFLNGDGTGTIRTFVFNQQAQGPLGENARASYAAASRDPFDGSGTESDRDVELLFQVSQNFGA